MLINRSIRSTKKSSWKRKRQSALQFEFKRKLFSSFLLFFSGFIITFFFKLKISINKRQMMFLFINNYNLISHSQRIIFIKQKLNSLIYLSLTLSLSILLSIWDCLLAFNFLFLIWQTKENKTLSKIVFAFILLLFFIGFDEKLKWIKFEFIINCFLNVFFSSTRGLYSNSFQSKKQTIRRFFFSCGFWLNYWKLFIR